MNDFVRTPYDVAKFGRISRSSPTTLRQTLGLSGQRRLRPDQAIELLAIREGKSERSIRMTLSLAFLSPALAEAAMEGRLPRGFCIKRLTDLLMLWSEQWRAIGLQAPAHNTCSRSPRH